METEIMYVSLKDGTRIRVVEEGRENSTVFVRPLGEKEKDIGETVKFDSQQEELIITKPVYIAPLSTDEGDILTWVRVVPDGREGSTVYGRTLRLGELDTGLAPQLRPGDSFAFRANSLEYSVDSVDAHATEFEDGYALITNTVWTWLSVCSALLKKNVSDEVCRLLVSAARRLDSSHEAFFLLHTKLQELKTVSYSIRQKTLVFEIVGLVEIAIIAMNRALQMADELGKRFSLSTPFPASVKNKLEAIKNLRDAYEHIDNRAFGLAGQKPKLHPDALSVFNYERLFQEGIATYGSYELDIYNETIQLLIDTRQYLKEVTAELAAM